MSWCVSTSSRSRSVLWPTPGKREVYEQESSQRVAKILLDVWHHQRKKAETRSSLSTGWIDRSSKPMNVKGAVSQYSVISCPFFCASKNGDCSRKCCGHQTMTARSAVRTASPAKLSRANAAFLKQLLFSVALPCGRHYFPRAKMAAKITNYRDTAALSLSVAMSEESLSSFSSLEGELFKVAVTH